MCGEHAGHVSCLVGCSSKVAAASCSGGLGCLPHPQLAVLGLSAGWKGDLAALLITLLSAHADKNEEACSRLASAGAKVAPTPAALASTPGAGCQGGWCSCSCSRCLLAPLLLF